jgi:hypothetical protein
MCVCAFCFLVVAGSVFRGQAPGMSGLAVVGVHRERTGKLSARHGRAKCVRPGLTLRRSWREPFAWRAVDVLGRALLGSKSESMI